MSIVSHVVRHPVQFMDFATPRLSVPGVQFPFLLQTSRCYLAVTTMQDNENLTRQTNNPAFKDDIMQEKFAESCVPFSRIIPMFKMFFSAFFFSLGIEGMML